MNRTQIKDSLYNAMKETNRLMKETNAKVGKWETLVSNQSHIVDYYESLYSYAPAEDIGKRLDIEYRRFDLYTKMYKSARCRADEIEQALCGIEKACYWL